MEKMLMAMARIHVILRIHGRYSRPYDGRNTAHAGKPLSYSCSSRMSLCNHATTEAQRQRQQARHDE